MPMMFVAFSKNWPCADLSKVARLTSSVVPNMVEIRSAWSVFSAIKVSSTFVFLSVVNLFLKSRNSPNLFRLSIL